MILNIFENYEILGELSNKMELNTKCGNLFIEILNNYSNIKEQLLKAIKNIEKDKYNHIIKNYIQALLIPNIDYTLTFFYNTIQFEFGEICNTFSNTKRNLRENLESITKTLKYINKKENDYEFLKKYKKKLEISLEEYTYEKSIQNQLVYIDSLLHDLELNYYFIDEYSNIEHEYYFKTFEIPREIISCVIKENNYIKLLESKKSIFIRYFKRKRIYRKKFW